MTQFSFKRNQAECPLEVSFSEPSGVAKTNVDSATVRVFRVVGGSEVDVLPEVALVRVGSTNRYRYVWEPTALPEGDYLVEVVATDTDLLQTRVVTSLYVHATQPSREVIVDEQLIQYDGDVEVDRFNLFDVYGRRTNIGPMERVRVG